MAVTVRIPTTLRPLSGGTKLVEVESGTLAEVISRLDAVHTGFADRLLDEQGGLRKFVNIFVDDDETHAKFSAVARQVWTRLAGKVYSKEILEKVLAVVERKP